MVAIDTNVLVRLVVNDDPDQTRKVLTVLEAEAVFVPVTVVLESEWVLRHCYALTVEVVCRVFREVLATAGVVADEGESVKRAVALHERNGLDFADALHLCLGAKKAGLLCTFDRRFANNAPKDAGIEVKRL